MKLISKWAERISLPFSLGFLLLFLFAHSLAVYCLGDEIDKQNTVSRWLDWRTEYTHARQLDARGERHGNHSILSNDKMNWFDFYPVSEMMSFIVYCVNRQTGCLKETKNCVSYEEEIPDVHSLWCSFQENCIWKLSHRHEHEKMFVCFQILSQRQQIFFTELIMHSHRIVLKTNNSLNLKITTNKEHTTFPLFLRLFCEQKRKKQQSEVSHLQCGKRKYKTKISKCCCFVMLAVFILFYFIRTYFCELWDETSKFSLDFAHIHSLFYDANIWLMCFILLFKCIAYLL